MIIYILTIKYKYTVVTERDSVLQEYYITNRRKNIIYNGYIKMNLSLIHI